jgi:hypothetical protein
MDEHKEESAASDCIDANSANPGSVDSGAVSSGSQECDCVSEIVSGVTDMQSNEHQDNQTLENNKRVNAKKIAAAIVCVALIVFVVVLCVVFAGSSVFGTDSQNASVSAQSEQQGKGGKNAASDKNADSEEQESSASSNAESSSEDAGADGNSSSESGAGSKSSSGQSGTSGASGGSSSSGASSQNSGSEGGQESGGSTGEGESSQTTPSTISVYVSIDGKGYTSGGGSVTLSPGATAYDALCQVASIGGSSTYVSSINGVAEKQHGAMSGWMYYVNGSAPNVPCGSYVLQNGDAVTWVYVNVES